MRRVFELVLFLTLSGCISLFERSDERQGIAILQGATSDKVTELAFLFPLGNAVEPVLRKKGQGDAIPATASETFSQEGSTWTVLQKRYENLDPDATYQLDVKSGDVVVDQRELQTLKVKKKEPIWAIVSCMNDSLVKDQEAMWNELLSLRPDFILFLGDNVYADRLSDMPVPANPERLWERYSETRNRLEIFRAKRLIPVFATWDDHDYGINDGDTTYPHKEASLKVFKAFFPAGQINSFFERGPGTSSRFLLSDQRFILMDDRFFRSPNNKGKPETHWGEEQEKWLLSELQKSQVPTWLGNGNQVFGGYHKFESYEGNHPQSFRRMIKDLKATHTPLVFLSGDRHLVELMKIEPAELGYPTYEITSSAIHSKTYPDAWKDNPNARKIEGASGVYNYALIKSLVTKNAMKFVVTAYGPAKKVLFRRELEVPTK